VADDDEEPRLGLVSGEESPSELTEQRFAANLRALREISGVSQVSLAQEMANRGWPWRQQTVTRVENGQRMVRLGEARAVAEILKTSIDRLTQPTEETREIELLSEWMRQAKGAWRQIVDATAALLNAQANLGIHPAVKSSEPPTSPRMLETLQEVKNVRRLNPEGAVAQGIAQRARSAEFFAERAGEEGSVTIRPETVGEASRIAEALRDGEVVILDLTKVRKGGTQRLIDFADGAVRVRRGSMERTDRHLIFRLVPAAMDASEMAISAVPPEKREGS
jgi:FtsZ-interacting cell division protein YlmF